MQRPNNTVRLVLCMMLIVGLSLCSMGCRFYARSQQRIIRDFEENLEAFQLVAAYIEVFDLAEYALEGRNTTFEFFTPNSIERPWLTFGKENPSIPECSDELIASVNQLYQLGYSRLGKSVKSGNTIVFSSADGYGRNPLRFYYLQGIAYVANEEEPKPFLHLDTAIYEITDLGNGWYYWNGEQLVS